MISRACLIILPIVLLLLQGCVAVQTFPTIARAGDTVVLAVGTQDGMTRQNTEAYFTSDAPGSLSIPITNIRAIFNLYADKKSGVYNPFSSQTINLFDNFNRLKHEQWLTVVVLDLPTSLISDPGPGTVTITTSAPQNPNLPSINTKSIALEILPGTGQSNAFNYFISQSNNTAVNSGLDLLEQEEQLIIKPPETDTGGWPTYGAIEIKLTPQLIDINNLGVTDFSFRVVSQDISYQTLSRKKFSWSYLNNELTVSFISPTGKLHYFEPRFSLVALDSRFVSIDNVIHTVSSVKYFDINGDVVSGPLPSEYTVQVLKP